MATHADLTEALDDFAIRCNENQRLRKMQRDWTRNLVIRATDIESVHTMIVVKGETSIEQGATRQPDIIVSAISEILADMFWGDLNPSEKYMSGELRVQGTQEDVMRLDAVSLIIWG